MNRAGNFTDLNEPRQNVDICGNRIQYGDLLIIPYKHHYEYIELYRVESRNIDSGIIALDGSRYRNTLSTLIFPDTPEAILWLLSKGGEITPRTYNQSGFDAIGQPLAIGDKIVNVSLDRKGVIVGRTICHDMFYVETDFNNGNKVMNYRQMIKVG